jgi:SAM-dependent methyltransferase
VAFRKIKAFIRGKRLNSKILSEVGRALELNRGNDGTIRLPAPYGRNLPERAIEIFFARLYYKPGLKVLDVGCSNAMECHLRMVRNLEPPRNIAGIDIAIPSERTRRYYDRFLHESIVSSRIEAGSFDLIWCISALEHFGMDNSSYTDQFILSEEMDVQAMKEMVRILARGGRLLVTIPYGKYENQPWLRNYDGEHLRNLLAPVECHADIRTSFYRHTHGAGWRVATVEELEHVGYYDQSNSGAAGLAVITATKR